MSQRGRLLVLLLAATLPLVVLASLLLREGYEEARARAEQEQLSVASAAAMATSTFIRDNLRTLQSLAVELAGADGRPLEETRARLAALIAVNGHWNGMSIVGTDGHVILGARPESDGSSLSGRPYIEEFLETREPIVSDGVITTVTLTPSVIVAVPLRLADGSTGALLAAVTLQELAEELQTLLIPTPGVYLSLVDRTGQRLVHHTPSGLSTLEPIGSRPEVAAALAGESGITEVQRDRQDMLVAYTGTRSVPWAVTAAEPTSSALAPARALAIVGVVTIGVSALIVVLIGWFVGGRLARSYESVTRSRRESEAALARAEAALRSRDEFLAIASHELRNPVAAVKGLAQLMQRRLDRGLLEEATLREYLRDVGTASDYLARLVEDLLDVSRLEGGQLDVRTERADLADIVRRALDDAPLANHHLELEAPNAPVTVDVDPDRIHQVLTNLLENAVKYSPPGSRILVRVDRDEDGARVAVTDEGIGLPDHETRALFTPFGRASNAQTANIPGLGLGLYVSRRFAEAHHGTLRAASAGEGQGSTFTLSLPASIGLEAAAVPPEGAVAAPEDAHARR